MENPKTEKSKIISKNILLNFSKGLILLDKPLKDNQIKGEIEKRFLIKNLNKKHLIKT